MARRIIDAPKGMVAPEQISDHSETSLLYPNPKVINPNPISTPTERSRREVAARKRAIKSLRKSSIMVGLYVTLPYVVGLVVIQQVIMRIPSIAPGDIGGAMFIVFMSFFTALGTIAVSYLSLKRADSYFYSRALRMWPVAATILASVAFATGAAFRLATFLPGEPLSYIGALAAMFAVGVVVATASIAIWTGNASIPAKFIGLGLIVIIASSALLFS